MRSATERQMKVLTANSFGVFVEPSPLSLAGSGRDICNLKIDVYMCDCQHLFTAATRVL